MAAGEQADHGIDAVARRHGVSVPAVRALAEALRAGGGSSAQWSHAELGGMGQWSRGGMLQIADMFNHDLKAKVAAVLDDLAAAPPAATASAPGWDYKAEKGRAWWPADLGEPASSGSQNAMRYACFPEKRRLVIERDGRLSVYDTGRHRLTGFSQAQSDSQHLAFDGPDGAVPIDALVLLQDG